MGANKKKQMHTFDVDWANRIWSGACKANDGRGTGWRLALAAIAVTGCRPAALEAGIVFSLVKDGGRTMIEAIIPGVKLTKERGQPEYRLRWGCDSDTHRPEELRALIGAVLISSDKRITVRYDAEAISTRLREMSKAIWPRRKHHITGYCYRNLFSAEAKASGAEQPEIAAAMGHLSTRSQSAYSRAHRKGKGVKPWAKASAATPVRENTSSMASFKRLSAIKRSIKPSRS